MWVWIPRFAYKITYYTDSNKTTVSETKTQYGSIDVVFLVGTTDYYYKDGGLQKAQRATSDNTAPTTNGDKYTVHPAFTDESSIDYANGGWNSELTGIWVAKFEAGLPDNSSDSKVTVTGKSQVYYPVFQGLKYSYNYIDISTVYTLSQAIAKEGNPYGLSSTSTNSHLMKNSEWGAVAYLSQSQYGLNGTNILINNVNYNGTKQSVKTENNKVYAVTGYSAGEKANEGENTLTSSITLGDTVTGSKTSYAWYTTEGVTASSTGTIYGIYDLSGGAWEYTASYVANGNNLLGNGTALTTSASSSVGKKYVVVYVNGEGNAVIADTDTDEQKRIKYLQANYEENVKIGDAISETSIAGTGNKSWYSDASNFAGGGTPFFKRGGGWNGTSTAGLFSFSCDYGGGFKNVVGFRAVLVGM
jgi:hypothetical protein